MTDDKQAAREIIDAIPAAKGQHRDDRCLHGAYWPDIIATALFAARIEGRNEGLEWQPINSAPLDKTTIALLRVDAHGVIRHGIGWYMPLNGWFCSWYREGCYDPPTYWCLLPHTSSIRALKEGTFTGPKFAQTHCSQCGASFGPGDSGFSHCEQHRALKENQ